MRLESRGTWAVLFRHRMKGFSPSIFDRMMCPPRNHSGTGVPLRLSLDELKESVARDLEALLNARAAVASSLFSGFPECANSILNYGLHDFACISLASTDDRAYICRCLEETIARHEPRLRNVRAFLEVQEGAVNRLNFAISALLIVHTAREPVNFDAVLQPATLQYSISWARRAARGEN